MKSNKFIEASITDWCDMMNIPLTDFEKQSLVNWFNAYPCSNIVGYLPEWKTRMDEITNAFLKYYDIN